MKIQLTKRELEVLKYTADGYTLQGIADLLGVSMATVVTHSRNLVKKFPANNMKHAITLAFRMKLIK